MLLFLLFGAIFAQNYLGLDCSGDCIDYESDRTGADCIECQTLGCTPHGTSCRPFTCEWSDLLGDRLHQDYDITCNWDRMEEWGPLTQRDPGCATGASVVDCSANRSSGGIFKDLKLYRQAPNCAEEYCPDWATIHSDIPVNAECTLTCRSDNAAGGKRTCTAPSTEKMTTCKKRCTEGQNGCPDWSCEDLGASWTGDFQGGKWDVCWADSGCGNSGMTTSGTSCCNNDLLGIGTGERDATGKAAGCEDKCTCSGTRTCKTWARKSSGRRYCAKYNPNVYRCCGAMSLSVMFMTIAILFML